MLTYSKPMIDTAYSLNSIATNIVGRTGSREVRSRSNLSLSLLATETTDSRRPEGSAQYELCPRNMLCRPEPVATP